MKRDLAAGLLALIGLVLSTALLVDSLAPAPAFCAEGGCAAVRATGWAAPLGVPLPAFGIGFFALALGLGAAGPAAHRARRLLAIGGGLVGLGLLALQSLVIGAWCQLCVVVDVAAILHAIALVTARPSPRAGRARLAFTAALVAAAIGLPFTRMSEQPMVVASALPDVVAREQVPGTVVVVDFVDFECRFCRAFHARLGAALAEVDVPVRVVRKMVPLPMHRGAVPAALAWCCADEQGKGDEMADALFAAPAADLTPDGIQRIADSVGVDLAAVDSPANRARVERDLAAAEAANIQSLPTVYIGDRVFVGAGATVDELTLALRRASS